MHCGRTPTGAGMPWPHTVASWLGPGGLARPVGQADASRSAPPMHCASVAWPALNWRSQWAWPATETAPTPSDVPRFPQLPVQDASPVTLRAPTPNQPQEYGPPAVQVAVPVTLTAPAPA